MTDPRALSAESRRLLKQGLRGLSRVPEEDLPERLVKLKYEAIARLAAEPELTLIQGGRDD